METIAFCEREPFCQAVLKKHWPDVPCHGDVTTLDGRQYAGRVDVICGGFPCQDISLAGKGAGLAGERSGLWFEYRRLIKEIKPKVVVIENVSALRSRGLEEVLRSLAEIGYDAEWHCIPASAIGAPHRRDRVWIIAYPAGTEQQGNISGTLCERERSSTEGRREDLRQENGQSGSDITRSISEVMADTESGGYARGKSCNEAGTEREIESGRKSEGMRFAELGDKSGIQDDASLADSDNARLQGRLSAILSKRASERAIRAQGSSIRDTSIEGLPDWCGGSVGQPEPITQFELPDGREVEYDFCGISYGVSLRVDRLRSLGNSIVPQIAQIIGQAILEAERQVT